MATVIERPGPEIPHYCVNELNPHASSFPEMVKKSEQPQGTVVRCSCGILWVVRHYINDYNHWKKAGLWLQFKHRGDGWEGVKDGNF